MDRDHVVQEGRLEGQVWGAARGGEAVEKGPDDESARGKVQREKTRQNEEKESEKKRDGPLKLIGSEVCMSLLYR